MTTITRRIAAARRSRPRVYLSTLLLPVGAVVAFVIAAASSGGGSTEPRPNLSLNIAGVSCVNAQGVASDFKAAVNDATKDAPDYTSVETFGFKPPVNPGDVTPLRELLQTRQSQLDQKVGSVDAGTCTDSPAARVIDADGKSVTLPVVDGDQPNQPISGGQSNLDTRTVPVTIGAHGNQNRTNTWGELNDLFGGQKWYTDCANSNLAMHWGTDVSKFMATESQHDNRFILAVHVSSKLTDDEIRVKAAEDGNPHTSGLPVVRVESIINTRHLGNHQCDPFIDMRSMIRVSLGKVVFDGKGKFKGLEKDEGIFVDCHNLWRLPKSTPTPIIPHPSPMHTPSHPGTPGTTPPHSTPSTTQPPTCTNGGTPPKCLSPKDPNQGAAHNGNVPTQVQGSVGPDPKEPRPSNPPTSYKPPPPPPAQTTQPAPPRTTPPPESSAPQPSNPATGCVPPPGMQTC